MKKAVSASRMGETVPIESPIRASKSNGMMEGAVRRWQEQLRTIKHYTEAKLGKRIEVDSPMFSWLIPYCADIINKFRVGADGRTAYERITSHKCKSFVVGFGETVDYIRAKLILRKCYGAPSPWRFSNSQSARSSKAR